MTRILLVPDLPMERWPSMDRYALRLSSRLQQDDPDLDIEVAASIGRLTEEHDDRSTPAAAGRTRAPEDSLIRELRRYVARYWAYPIRVGRRRADLMHILDHSYAHVLRAHRDVPVIVTVHDLMPVKLVQQQAKTFRNRLRNRLLESVLVALRQASAWIVATEWLRDELAEWLGHADGISVIPYGVDDAFFEPPELSRDAARQGWAIDPSAFVVLHVGSVVPRKNFTAVIAAVDGLRQSGVNAWLLQCGATLTADQQADIAQRQLGDVVRARGASSESDLRAAYRASDVLLFPSHYEGFGLPVLEAMASGLPVVTSGAGGLGEVASDAAMIVGGREVEPYVSALAGLVEDPERCRELAARGIKRAETFRWAETARKTAELYRELAGA
ncbi:MAG: glycosyltransferase family 1 protein [Gemmatimonadetes bacterium]|nr:glycosyltransferase family 1 protein [Gemmatimonadota bacterium]